MDNASATPVDKRVMAAMAPYFSRDFGNPSAIHKEGVSAKKVIENARKDIAGILKSGANEIVFTNGATESLNFAIRGAILARGKHKIKNPEIITSAIEHEAVLGACRSFEKYGVKVHYIKPEENGIIKTGEITKYLNKNTVLVSIMYANNEIGTIQPIKEIGRAVKLWKISQTKNLKLKTDNYPLFHTDAVQASNYLNLDVNSLGVQLLTLNSAKIYGPKGIAVLYVKKGVELEPIIYGGGQERGLRAGTENVPLIAGLAKAFSIAQAMKDKESKRLIGLRDYFITELLSLSPHISLNGDARRRLPNNINIRIDGIDNEFFVIQLDENGISASTQSACISASGQGSHVILSLGKTEKEAKESIRFSLGRSTTKKEIDYTLKTINNLLKAENQ
ncbi:MAG: cysteine desulfurase family protein [Patescibacteria group bacterium]